MSSMDWLISLRAEYSSGMASLLFAAGWVVSPKLAGHGI